MEPVVGFDLVVRYHCWENSGFHIGVTQLRQCGSPRHQRHFFNGQEYYADGTLSAAAVATGVCSGHKDANHLSSSQAQSFTFPGMAIKIGSGH
jgi:hypothetical protein